MLENFEIIALFIVFKFIQKKYYVLFKYNNLN